MYASTSMQWYLVAEDEHGIPRDATDSERVDRNFSARTCGDNEMMEKEHVTN